MWRIRRRRDPEIAPEEIFLDSSSTQDFDRSRFEGSLEQPLPLGTFYALSGALVLLMVVIVFRAWHLQITRGASFANQSAHNSLQVQTVFAPRGVIRDVHDIVVADNITRSDGTMIRHYPYASMSHVLGYVSYPKKDAHGVYYDTDETGVTGVEAKYNQLLAGKNGQLLAETDALGNVRSQGGVVPAIDGDSLKLSIDVRLQELLEQAIRQTASDHRFIAGAGAVIDVHTGAVRALVSYPSYDSNVMSNGSPAETIARYNEDPGHPFLDHALQGMFTPGSIVKPVVAAGALTDGIITSSTVINDPGSMSIDDPYNPGKKYVYTGWKALGLVDVKQAIAWSSDIFFYTVGGGFKSQKGLGIDRLAYWYREFGFGTTTGIGVSGEVAGVIPTPEWKKKTFNESWYLGDTYFTAIGQYAMQVTPLQAARATAAIANGGRLIVPTLIDGEVSTSEPVPVTESVLSVVRDGMRRAVTSAIAGAINLPYVAVAAKTGTAQTGSHNQYDNSWVVGFFPYGSPQYAFAVVLERGPQGAGEQSVNVMRQLFDSLHAENSPYVGGTATTTP